MVSRPKSDSKYDGFQRPFRIWEHELGGFTTSEAAFFLVRPAGRTLKEVKVLYTAGMGKCQRKPMGSRWRLRAKRMSSGVEGGDRNLTPYSTVSGSHRL